MKTIAYIFTRPVETDSKHLIIKIQIKPYHGTKRTFYNPTYKSPWNCPTVNYLANPYTFGKAPCNYRLLTCFQALI
jgi:hypothetical protein